MLIAHRPVDDDFDGLVAALKAAPDPFSNLFHRLGHPAESTSISGVFNEDHQAPPSAHMISQGGLGFSASHPIGTEHVANCVAVIVRDPVSHKTALAHYDARTRPQSLDLLFDRMPSHCLDVLLIGAKFSPETIGKDYERDTSLSNLENVTAYLASKNVDIVAALIHDPQQSHAMIVDPETFRLYKAAPDIPNPDNGLVFAKKFLTPGEHDLEIAFDLTASPDKFPILLGEKEVDALNRHVQGKTPDDIQEWYRSKSYEGDYLVPMTLDFLKAYEHAVGQIAEDLDAARNDLERNGIPVSDSSYRAVQDAARAMPVHIGQNAPLANKAFSDCAKDAHFSFDAENFKFPDTPGRIPEQASAPEYAQDFRFS